MDYQIVTPSEVGAVWPHIAGWVDTARGVDHSFGVDDIKALCEGGQYELWLVTEGDEYFGFLIGTKAALPRGHVYFGLWLGGRDLARWAKGGLAAVESHARSLGCMAYSFVGRKAWERLLGYDYQGVYYFKNL